jgi:hypothetical protein
MSDRMSCRGLAVAVAVALCLASTPGLAAPGGGGEAGADVAAFEAGFQAGQAQFDAGEFLAAARTWKGAAGKLPRTADQKANRAALHDYMADAYEKAAAMSDDPAVAREGLAALDEYVEQFTAAYPGEEVSPQLASIRGSLRGRVEAIDAAEAPREPATADPETPTPPPRATDNTRRGLTIGGGVALAGGAAMLGMFAVGYARTSKYEAEIENPALDCRSDDLTGLCATFDAKGRSANAMAVAGLVLAPVLVGTGVALLVVAARRKQQGPVALAPEVGRGFVGLRGSLRF